MTIQRNRGNHQLPEEIEDAIGVQECSLDEWLSNLDLQLDRLACTTASVSNRHLRQSLEKVEGKLIQIKDNCAHVDPDDIRTEIALDIIVGQFIDALNLHLKNSPDQASEELKTWIELTASKLDWATNLLTRMQSNDDDDAISRARVLSSIFNAEVKSK